MKQNQKRFRSTLAEVLCKNLQENTCNGVLFSVTLKCQANILNTFWNIFKNSYSAEWLMTDVSVNHFQNSHSRLCSFLVYNVSGSRPIFVIYWYNHKGYWPEKEWPIGILEKKAVLRNFSKFKRKHLCLSPFLKKRDTNAGVFIWILLSFPKYLFLKNLGVTASEEILTPYSSIQKCFNE